MSTPTSTCPSASADYVGQDVDGKNEAGCPFVGQTIDTAVSSDSLTVVAQSLGISVEDLRAML